MKLFGLFFTLGIDLPTHKQSIKFENNINKEYFSILSVVFMKKIEDSSQCSCFLSYLPVACLFFLQGALYLQMCEGITVDHFMDYFEKGLPSNTGL